MGDSIFGSINFIGEGAFYGSGIDKFVIDDDITSIEAYAFTKCDNLTLVTMSKNLTKIGEYAFSECTKLITITLPDSLTIIGQKAFSDCTNLTSVTLPDNVNIGERAFSDCTSLISVTLPNNATIGKEAFSDCTNLTTIIFSSSVTIEPSAFTNSPLSVETVKTLLDVFQYKDDELLAMGINQETITAACFSENTNILCLNLDSKEEYIPVKKLKRGDLVKTYLHGYRKINIMCKGILKNNINKFRDCMYKMKKTDENGLIEDLIITGGHSIMVDELTKEEYDKTVSIWKLDQVDNKYLLMAGISNKFEQIQGEKIFKYYHFSLENDGNPDNRYGVFANGVLVETPSETDIKTFKTVVFI